MDCALGGFGSTGGVSGSGTTRHFMQAGNMLAQGTDAKRAEAERASWDTALRDMMAAVTRAAPQATFTFWGDLVAWG